MDDLITLLLILSVVAMLSVLVLLWRIRSAWPEPGLKRDVFVRRRLLQPRRRLLPCLHLPHLRLRR